MGRKRKIGKSGEAPPTSVKTSRSPKRTKFGGSKQAGNNVNKDDTGNENGNSEIGSGTELQQVTVGVSEPTRLERGEIPPLLNELILTNLFKYLPLDELPTHRLVCRTWHDVSLSKWRSSAPLIFRYSDPDGVITLNDGTSLSEFQEFWNDHCESKPYRNFHLEDWSFGGKKNVDETFSRFWQLFGGHMHKLKMSDCRSAKSNGVFKYIRQHCPNLESLILEDVTFYPGHGYRRKRMKEELHPNLKSLHVFTRSTNSIEFVMQLTYVELLSNFPNLTYFKLGCDWQRLDIRAFCKAVISLRMEDPNNKLPITRIGTRDPVEIDDRMQSCREMLDLLIRASIPLESLFFVEDMGLNFKELIEFHGSSLTKMYYYLNENSPRWSFPYRIQLGELRVLEISDDVFYNLDFIMFAPNLEQLRIIKKPNEGSWRVPSNNATLVSETSQLQFVMSGARLLKLTRFTMELDVSEEDLRFLAICMPNLRNLRMSLNDELFPIVCEYLQELVELEVFGDGVTDKGVTGMKFRRISVATVEVDGELAIRPNITFLKQLEVFHGSKTKLTNRSFSRGFLNLNNLRKITLARTTLIKPDIMMRLREKNIKLKQSESFEAGNKDSFGACSDSDC